MRKTLLILCVLFTVFMANTAWASTVTFNLPENADVVVKANGMPITSGTECDEGTELSFEITPDEGYRLLYIQYSYYSPYFGNQISSMQGTTITIGSSPYYRFTINIVSIAITVNVAETTNGNVSLSVDGEPREPGANFLEGETVTVTATPDEGYVLNSLKYQYTVLAALTQTITRQIDVNTPPYTFIIANNTKDYTVMATFLEPAHHTITCQTQNMTFSVDGVIVPDGGSVAVGKRVDISLPEIGYNSYLIGGNVETNQTDANHFYFTMPDYDVSLQANVLLATSYELIIPEFEHGTVEYSGSLVENTTVTLTVHPDIYYRLKEGSLKVRYSDDSNAELTDNGNGVFTFTITDAAIVEACFEFDTDNFEQSDTNEYTIKTETGWNYFCDALEDNDTWNGFSGKTVKLGADISIERAAGSAGHEFMGTFDGDYHTLTVNITETTTQGTAPFREIKGATIKNVITTGNVNGTAHASGLVGFARGDASVTNTIERCKVGANVTVTTADQNGNYHCGGVVGHAIKSNLNISNTVYCGAITNRGNHVGGFQGWCDGNTITLNNCLFTGSYSGGGVFHPVAVRNKNNATTATVTNTFYTVLPTQTDAAYIAADGKKTTGNANIPINLGNQEEEINFMTVYEGGMLYDGLYYAAPTLTTDSDGAYLINNATDWDMFCDALQDNDTWNRFSGKTVKLGADISVTRMAGSSYHDFCGTFDGQCHTLTFTSTENTDGVAPFSYISETTPTGGSEVSHSAIRNLNVIADITTTATHASGLVGRQWGAVTIEGCTVGGTITTSAKYAAGFIGQQNGTADITDCVSSVTIQSSVEGDGTLGGFVAIPSNTLNITGCLFNGKLITTNSTTSCGGFVGWHNGKTVTVSNSLYAPAALADGENAITTDCATLVRGWSGTPANSYYTAALGTAQGKQAFSITGGEDVAVAASGEGTVYDVSGITAYSNSIKYDNVLYSGNNEEVLLNLGCTLPEGYAFGGYTVNAGTLTGDENPYTLTMPAEDVVIAASYYVEPMEVNYIDRKGNQQTTMAIPLMGNETTIGDGWYVVNHDISYPGAITIDGNVNLILADSCTMNVGASEIEDEFGNNVLNSIMASNKFNIYGQGGDTEGLLVASASILAEGYLTINGGNVSAKSVSRVESSKTLDVTIYGGTLTAITEERKKAINVYYLTIYNGKVTAHSNEECLYAYVLNVYGGEITAVTDEWSIGINGNGIIISGGKVTAHGGMIGISSRKTTISGGQVEAIGYNGIFASNAIKLGCTDDSDYITASNFSVFDTGSVSIINGQTLYDQDGNAYTDETPSEVLTALTNVTLRPVVSIVLGDVNGDGFVTSSDVTVLYDYLLTGDTTYLQNGDVNGDGFITSADVTAVYDILLGN